MQLDVISWFLLTSFTGVFADKRMVEQGSLVPLIKNVVADNTEKDVSVFVNGDKTPTLVVTFKIVNGFIQMEWKTDNYSKMFMDANRNIWIANIDETYERTYYIQSNKTHKVELTILKTNYPTTVRTALNENTQKGDALPDRRSSDTGYVIASIVLLLFLIFLMVILIVVIMKKNHRFSWILCKKSNNVLQPVQVTSPSDSANSTSYQLIWNRPADEYQLQKYILRYREIQSMEQPWPLGLFLSVDDIPASTVSYQLSPLTPGRCYQVEIQAINTQGHSSNYFNFRTKESVPQPVQVTSHRDSPDSTSYQLMWNKPDDGGSSLIKYIIRYCEVEIIPDGTEYELSKYLKLFEPVDNILPSVVSYKLSPLTPGRYYLVEIQAINTQGRSLKSFIIKTKEDFLPVVPDFQLPVQHAPCLTSPIVTDETNPKFRRLSKKIEMLQPRNNDTVFTENIEMLPPRNSDTVFTDTQSSTSNVEQNTNIKSKKGPEEKLESLDSDSDSNDEQDKLLKDPVDQNL